MQVSEWAEQILFGTSLEDKLSTPEALTDFGFKQIELPHWPGRDSQICLEKKASKL